MFVLDLETIIKNVNLTDQSSGPNVLVTMVYAEGSSPLKPGSKILADSEGNILWGTIGGGALEAFALHEVKKFNFENSLLTNFKTINLQTDLGMSCGGAVSLFFEKIFFQPTQRVAVFGAGHIGQELVPLLLKANFHVTWVDDRKEWLYKTNHALDIEEKRTLLHLDRKCTEDFSSVINQLPIKTFIIILTKGHETDYSILKMILPKKFLYVGVIGSRTKFIVLKNQLQSDGFLKDEVDSIHCPIGEPWAKDTPFEIAIGILSKLLQLTAKDRND